jgi:hypothetical protein
MVATLHESDRVLPDNYFHKPLPVNTTGITSIVLARGAENRR